MNKFCGLNIKLDENEKKYYSKVFKYSCIVPLITFFLLASMAVSNLVKINYLMSVFVILLTIYFLYTIQTSKVGTKHHLYSGLLLVGSYIFYSSSSYNLILGIIISFVVFITYINGRELQIKAKNNTKKM